MNRIEWEIDRTNRLRYLDNNRLPSNIKPRIEKLRDRGVRVLPLAPKHTSEPDFGPFSSEPDSGYLLPGAMIIAGIAFAFVALRFNPTVGSVVAGITLVAILVLGFRRNRELSRKERMDLSKATVVVQLSSFESSGRGNVISSSEVTRIASQAFGTARIDRLLAVAIGISNAIPETRAWGTEYLDTHRVQLNLVEEREQIVQHCLALRIATDRLGSEPAGKSAAARTAQRAFAVTRKQLDLVWTRLTERVAVLNEYLDSLIALDSELEHYEAARRALSVDDEIGALLANAVGDEVSAEHMRDLRDQTRAVTAAINELVESLDGNLQTLLAFSGTEGDHE
ncbi:hypothetical protein BFN03_13585 [Rhodococcus sp. WMMA185]|uniref:hypothetical protein n=1 Tax=Rhodococcus sp. WMMA185 TaxID=679318 RepID=UPI000877EA21|nr:hypothetical protein [Rhodococcus sp. WMMA185]AOW93333.1 hypothetical protein BFN03_13585 [Rhodococcus sp. WMMA185]